MRIRYDVLTRHVSERMSAVSNVKCYSDPAQVIGAATGIVVRAIAEAVASRGRAWIALAGGQTPRALYERLAAQPGVPWSRTWWCFGDERWVPHTDRFSNVAMVENALFGRAPIPREHILTVPTDLSDPLAGARAYENALRAQFPDATWPDLDLAILGLGADGHTASLLPGDPEVSEQGKWVKTARSPKLVVDRVTLAAPVFAHARAGLFVVIGADKARAVAGTIAGGPDPARWPAQAAAPLSGRCHWLLDQAAAGLLPEGFVCSPSG